MFNKCEARGATTLSITTFSIMTLVITTFSIMTLVITIFSVTIRKCDTEHNDMQCLIQVSFMLSVAIKSVMLSVVVLNVEAPV